MRYLISFVFIIVLMIIAVPSGNNDHSSLFCTTVYADTSSSPGTIDFDDDNTWPFEILAEDDSEEIEEENNNQENEEENQEEIDDELLAIFESLLVSESNPEKTQKDKVEENPNVSTQDDTGKNTSQNDGTGDILTSDISLPTYQGNWASVPGKRVSFFFLLPPESPGLWDQEEPVIASFKAIKFADQMLNGIKFKYQTNGQNVYLDENIESIYEYVHLTDRSEYEGVTRFEYEVALPNSNLESGISDLSIIVDAAVPSNSIANSFERSRREVLSEAIIKLYDVERLRQNKEEKDEVTGKITSFEVISEGYLQKEQAFYLQMRVWISFDSL